MGATASSSGRCEEDEAEELAVTAAANEAQGDGSADDKVEYIKSVSCLQRNASQTFKDTISESKDTHGLHLIT